MEIIDQNNPQNDPNWQQCKEDWQKRHRRGKIAGGIILVTAGALLLARQMGVAFPEWFFTWKVLLIVVGLFVGFKHGFRGFGWLIPVAIGGVFLAQDFYPEMHIGRMFWPIFIIAIGLLMIFKPRRGWNRHHQWKWEQKRYEHWRHRKDWCHEESFSEDRIETSSVFGSIKKNVISKDFKGGEMNCVFGGALLDLSQADIKDKAVLEVNCVFGGAKLVVPQHWQLQAGELVTVMGGIEDKRPRSGVVTDPTKVLVLRGTAVFGGIEILS